MYHMFVDLTLFLQRHHDASSLFSWLFSSSSVNLMMIFVIVLRLFCSTQTHTLLRSPQLMLILAD